MRAAIVIALLVVVPTLGAILVAADPSPTCESLVHDFYDYGCIYTDGTASCTSTSCVAASAEADARCGGSTCVAIAGDGPAQCDATDACAAVSVDGTAACGRATVCAPVSSSERASCDTPSTVCAPTSIAGEAACSIAAYCIPVSGTGTTDCHDAPTCVVVAAAGEARCGRVAEYYWQTFYETDVEQCVAVAGQGDAQCTTVTYCVAATADGDATCGQPRTYYYSGPHAGPLACSATSVGGEGRCHDSREDNVCVVTTGTGTAECDETTCVAVSALGDAHGSCILVADDGSCDAEAALAPFGTPPTLVDVAATPGVGEVFVAWRVPQSTDRQRVAAVRIERSLNWGEWTEVARVSIIEESRVDAAHLDKSVPAYASARYRLRSESPAGALGEYSGIVGASWYPSSLPPPELDVDATGPGPFVGQAIVVWRAPRDASGGRVAGVVRYDVYRSGGSEDNVDPTYATASDALGHAIGPGTEPRHRVASIPAAGDVRYEWIDEAPKLPRDHYYVVAVDASGGFSDYSAEDSAIWTPPTFGTVPLIDVDDYGAPRGHVDVCGGPLDAVARTLDDPRGCHLHLNLQTYADASIGSTGVHSNPFVDVYTEPGHALVGFQTHNLGESVLLGSAQQCPTVGYEVGVTPLQTIRGCN